MSNHNRNANKTTTTVQNTVVEPGFVADTNIRAEEQAFHFIADIEAAELATYREEFARMVEAQKTSVLARLTKRFTQAFDTNKRAMLRKVTRIVLEAGESQAFVSIAMYSDTGKDAQVKGSSEFVKTRNHGTQSVNVLSEHTDDDIVFTVVVGMNLVDVQPETKGRLDYIKRNPAKSEPFELYLKADGTWDMSQVELPELWLTAKLKDFMNGKIKSQWTGSQNNGFKKSVETVK